MVAKVIQRTLSVDDRKVDELKDELRRIREPGSWADGWTFQAFERKWRMTVSEAEQLVGKPVWKEVWEKS